MSHECTKKRARRGGDSLFEKPAANGRCKSDITAPIRAPSESASPAACKQESQRLPHDGAAFETALLELLRSACDGKGPDDYLITRDDGKPVKDFRGAWQNLYVRAGLGEYRCAECAAPWAGKRCECGGRTHRPRSQSFTICAAAQPASYAKPASSKCHHGDQRVEDALDVQPLCRRLQQRHAAG